MHIPIGRRFREIVVVGRESSQPAFVYIYAKRSKRRYKDIQPDIELATCDEKGMRDILLDEDGALLGAGGLGGREDVNAAAPGACDRFHNPEWGFLPRLLEFRQFAWNDEGFGR
jgi:hypothetical protein